MGFKRAITDAAGVSHPDAYYKVTAIKFDAKRKQVSFRCTVWHDQAARLANDGRGMQPLTGVEGPVGWQVKDDATKSPPVTDYTDYFEIDKLDPVDANQYKQAYTYAKLKLNDPSIVDIDPDE